MITSTPTQYREQQGVVLEESLVSAEETFSRNVSSSPDTILPGQAPTVVTRALEHMKITPPKKESNVKTRARLSVTANEHIDSQESFRKRLSSAPVFRRKNYINNGKLGGRSTSMEEIDFLAWKSNDSMGMDVGYEFWDLEESYCISQLFVEEEEREQMEELAHIEEMTKNKLFEIFTRMCPNGVNRSRRQLRATAGLTGVLATPEKRKASPLPELDSANPAKTACCDRDTEKLRRSHSIGSSPNLRHFRKAERSRTKSVSAVPKGQQKVTSWCKLIKK